MPRMGQSRTLPRIIITFVCAVLGASVGVCFQALRITGRPQEFRSLAKVVAGGQMVSNDSINWREQQADFYGTIIETLESAEMQRRALERVRALNPDLRDADVEIRVAQTKGSAIFNILATGSEPKYTKIFSMPCWMSSSPSAKAFANRPGAGCCSSFFRKSSPSKRKWRCHWKLWRKPVPKPNL
jgi:hypothetical protein